MFGIKVFQDEDARDCIETYGGGFAWDGIEISGDCFAWVVLRYVGMVLHGWY